MDDIFLCMENAQLKKAVEALTAELKTMKQNLEMLALENSDLVMSHEKKRGMNENTKAKWDYYHEHKAQVRKDMMGDVKWFEVKRVCDAQWLALVNIDSQGDKKDGNKYKSDN